ncbi:phospholipase D family protein [Ferrimonas marina]|uniref:phospholipase D family protein n=1 Tax=Ferrimonas marina TaxID=299255 RepID=UPI001F1E0098|nr:phospholipase D family protein [Ferrimonas marina]
MPPEIEHRDDPAVAKVWESQQHWQAQHDLGLSQVVLQQSGWDALAQRLALIETAQHSIDIQYYIWNSDASGLYLFSRLVAAADRGIQVRLLLDDINVDEREDLLATLDQHPNIEVRIFNPIPSRQGVAKWLRVLGDFSRLNRRMHNKTFTVDGRASIVGGRNIGDEYFDLSDQINFRDLDVLVMGPVVDDIEAGYSQYWSSPWAYPIDLLGGTVRPELPELSLAKAPVYQNLAALPQGQVASERFLAALMDEMTWAKTEYVADQPVPADVNDSNQPKKTARVLNDLAQGSQHSILIESAYLVLDDRQLEQLQRLTDRGIEVKALTNSMASNDLLPNHSGYAGRRKGMLTHGMDLFELKPDTNLCTESTRDEAKCAPQAAYGLHSKSAVFDHRILAIGSFNLNLRSIYLNTESVLLIDSEQLATELAAKMEEAMDETHSWHLELEQGQLRWTSGESSWTSEPEMGRWSRAKSRMWQLLPVEKYL